MAKIPLHYLIAEKVINLLEAGTHTNTYHDKLERGEIVQVESDIKSFKLSGEIFISSADIYEDLKLAAIKLIIRIQQELEMNNPLWHCPDANSGQLKAAMAQLRAKGIIERIADTDMYLINPAKIRKGRPLAIYGALYTYAKRMYKANKNWKPTTEDIKGLVSPKSINMISLNVENDNKLLE